MFYTKAVQGLQLKGKRKSNRGESKTLQVGSFFSVTLVSRSYLTRAHYSVLITKCQLTMTHKRMAAKL